MMSPSPGVTPKAPSLEGIGLSGQYVVVLQELKPKVCFPSTTWFIYIREDTFKLLLKHRNPNTTILGVTKTKYNDPRDLSYCYC